MHFVMLTPDVGSNAQNEDTCSTRSIATCYLHRDDFTLELLVRKFKSYPHTYM